MVTAEKTSKPYPGCLAHAMTGMFYSTVANQRQPQYTYSMMFYSGVNWRGGYYTVVRGEESLLEVTKI